MITLSDKLHDIFSSSFERLNYDWFERTKTRFQSLSPDPKTNSLVFVEKGRSPVYKAEAEYFENPETGEVEEFRDIDYYEVFEDKTEITLVDFCGRYTPLHEGNGWGLFPEIFLQRSSSLAGKDYNYKEVAAKLLQDVSANLSAKANANETKSFALKVITDFESAVEQFAENKPTDIAYRTVLKEFGDYFKVKLARKYALELMHSAVEEPKLYLDFDIKQSELAALLELLHSIGILRGDRISISKFAATHFRYQYNKEARFPRNANEFSEEWGKQSKNSSPGKKKVLQKLREAICK